MQKVRRLILCGAILFCPVAMLAQGTKADSTSRISEADVIPSSGLLPDAPRPQVVSSLAEEFGEQIAIGQSQSNAGANEATQDNSKQTPAADPTKANIGGSVLDTNGDTVPRATIVLEGPSSGDRQTVIGDENGAFQFGGLKPGVPYQITISLTDFETWK